MGLDNRHWTIESFVQRMSVGDWKQLLLNGQDRVIFGGYMRLLKAKRLGHGVVEVFKEKLKGSTGKACKKTLTESSNTSRRGPMESEKVSYEALEEAYLKQVEHTDFVREKYQEMVAKLDATNESLKSRIASLEAEMKKYKAFWAWSTDTAEFEAEYVEDSDGG